MSGEMKLYVVCGPPAGGKTRYGRDLAVRVGAVELGVAVQRVEREHRVGRSGGGAHLKIPPVCGYGLV